MKYYIRSGELEKIVSAHNPYLACEKALNMASGETIDYYFYVSEIGFVGPKNTLPNCGKDKTVMSIEMGKIVQDF